MIFCFGDKPCSAQGVVLALHLVFTPGGAQGVIFDAKVEAWFDHVQVMCLYNLVLLHYYRHFKGIEYWGTKIVYVQDFLSLLRE